MTTQTRKPHSPELVGLRVEIAPHLDAWMMGDRYGTIERVTAAHVFVRMDRSGKVRRIRRTDVNDVIG
jgi:hypothetical protein